MSGGGDAAAQEEPLNTTIPRAEDEKSDAHSSEKRRAEPAAKVAADEDDGATKGTDSRVHVASRQTHHAEPERAKEDDGKRHRGGVGGVATDFGNRPQPPHRHAPFVKGTVMVTCLAAVVSAAIWLHYIILRISRGEGGSAGVSGGVGAVAAEVRREAAVGAKKTLEKAKETMKTRAGQLGALVSDVRASKSGSDAAAKVRTAIKNADQAPELFIAARFLIALYYFNICADKYSEYVWRFQYYEYTQRYGVHIMDGREVTPTGIPWIAAGVVVCATLMIHNKAPVVCSLCILAYDVVDSLELLAEVFLTGELVLNELIMKKLALFGCTCLLVAHSVKDTVNVNAYAGLLFEDDSKPKMVGKRKSAALLASRLLMAGLFFFVGLRQLNRVVARDFALFTRRPKSMYRDGHDNNWLLVEFVLCVPLAVGYKSEWSARALALILFLEAFTCWNFWASHVFRPDHARSHFVTNLACGGGLLLLQAFGAGRYTVDAILMAKKKE